MSDTTLPPRVPVVQECKCPGCGKEFGLDVKAVFSPEKLTIAYKLEPGRKMTVDDYCKSLGALAKALKATAKTLGTQAEVQIENVVCANDEIATTVSVFEVRRHSRQDED